LPFITKEEIMDKGKSDGFTRIIAISQMFWLIVQMIVIASQHIEITQLEIATVAFASCAVIIYVLNWSKPKGVGVPLTLLSYPGPFPDEIIQALGQPRINSSVLSFFNWTFDDTSENFRYRIRTSPVLNHHCYMSSVKYGHLDTVCMILTSILFGAIHFAALNSTFPSHVEREIWLVSSAVSTGIMIPFNGGVFVSCFCGLFIALVRCSVADGEFIWDLAWRISKYFTLGLYIIARLFLIMELFRCLFFLSPSALVATWASSIPHVS